MRTGNDLRWIGIALIMVIIVLVVAPPAQAATVGGTVDTIDLGAKKMTIKETSGTKLTLAVRAFTRINRDAAPATLSGLALGDTVSVQYIGQTALKVAATGPAITTTSGPITALNLGTGVITIGSTNVQTSASTKITRNGQVVSLGQLTLHDTAVVHSSSGRAMSQEGEDDADDVVCDGPEEGEVKGAITAITGQQVTITPNGGTPVTVTVASNTQIEVGGEPATLANLQLGQTAESEYDPTTLVAFTIQVDIPDNEDDGEISGTVAAVDVTLGTLTITPSGGGTNLVLTVTAATEIQVNGENATLADVQVGMPVEAEYDTSTGIATEVQAGTCSDNQDGNSQGCDGQN